MRFKKGSKEAKAFMAKIRAKKGKKTVTKKPVKKISGSFAMFSKKGNDEVTKIVKYAKAKKLSWQAVLNMLEGLSNKYPEAYDTHVREIVYESFMKNKPVKKTQKNTSATKKPATKKATPKNLHKDTKSHNVNIRVVSGIKYDALKELEKTKNIILEQSDLLKRLQNKFKISKSKEDRQLLMMDIKTLKNNFIPHNKRNLKALQTVIKKSI